jgi:hypothetical protein
MDLAKSDPKENENTDDDKGSCNQIEHTSKNSVLLELFLVIFPI